MICVSLQQTDLKAFLDALKGVLMAEIRMDNSLLTEEDVRLLFKSHSRLIATCRPVDGWNDAKRFHLMRTAILSGAQYIDIEMDAEAVYRDKLISVAEEYGVGVIISLHNFYNTPPRHVLLDWIDKGKTLGADIVKLATMVNSVNDVSLLLSLYLDRSDIVVFGMGEKGSDSRIAALLNGASFMYAFPDNGKATAPGQLSVSTMQRLFKRAKVND